MPRKSFSEGPTGSNRVSVATEHEIRYWKGELGCSPTELQDAVVAVGTQASDVRRYLERQRRTRPAVQQQAART